jgi:hypothetical protein
LSKSPTRDGHAGNCGFPHFSAVGQPNRFLLVGGVFARNLGQDWSLWSFNRKLIGIDPAEILFGVSNGYHYTYGHYMYDIVILIAGIAFL